jgi:hypothetical protein
MAVMSSPGIAESLWNIANWCRPPACVTAAAAMLQRTNGGFFSRRDRCEVVYSSSSAWIGLWLDLHQRSREK